MANPAFRIHFLEWFQEFFLKEICDEFTGFSSGLWQTSFQKLRMSGKNTDLRISFRKKQLKFRIRTFSRFKNPSTQFPLGKMVLMLSTVFPKGIRYFQSEGHLDQPKQFLTYQLRTGNGVSL